MHASRSLVLLACSALAPATVPAASPLEDQVAALTQQVAALQQAVGVLQSMLVRDSVGNVRQLTAGDKLEQVSGSSTTRIGGADVREVTGASKDVVGLDSVLQVGRNESQQIGGSLGIAAARAIVLQAGDELTLKSGSAQIVLRKDGSITISGVRVELKSSGDLVLKGAKVLNN